MKSGKCGILIRISAIRAGLFMFERLTQKLNDSFRHLMGVGRFTDENMKTALSDVKKALIEADVSYDVVKDFVNRVRDKARGQEISRSLAPGQALIKVVHAELVILMGEAQVEINLRAVPPVVILMSGLQGSGKTTTVGKLARFLIERQKKSVMVVSCDVYRPAAIEQLKVLAVEVGAHYSSSPITQKPTDIAAMALLEAKKMGMDVLIVDTAGRLHIDDAMMAEIKGIHQALNPTETLFVVDGMTGQDAAKTAKVFDATLPLTGVVVTKLDGDARGGAILSIRQVTGKPIKLIGVGEKSDGLELFYPDRMASRILGMGDVLSLIEDLERTVDKEKAEKLAKKIQKGKGFDLEDFRTQLLEMNKMGGLAGIMGKLPGMSNIPQHLQDKVQNEGFGQMLAIISSMTLKERYVPDLINPSRKRRIALGSGTQIQDVNRVLKQYEQMQKMMQKFGKPGGMGKLMRQMQGVVPGLDFGNGKS